MLTNLAAAEHVGTVVLTSSQMPALPAGSFQPDDAVTSLKVAGLPLNVLLSDSTLTGVLRAGDTSTGSLSKSTEFDVQAAVPRRDGHDRRRGPRVRPHDRGGPAV